MIVVLLWLIGLALLASGMIMLLNRSNGRPTQTGTSTSDGRPTQTSRPASSDPGAEIPGSLPSLDPRRLVHRDHTEVEQELRDLGFTVVTRFDPDAKGRPGAVVRVEPGENGHVTLVAVPDKKPDKQNDNNLRTQ